MPDSRWHMELLLHLFVLCPVERLTGGQKRSQEAHNAKPEANAAAVVYRAWRRPAMLQQVRAASLMACMAGGMRRNHFTQQ